MNNKPYQGGGRLVTRLLGRLEIFHGDGVIEFRLRSDDEIRKRGVRTVLRIEGLPDVPRIEKGKSVVISLADYKDLLQEAKVVTFDSTGRERGKGAA